MKKSFVIVKPDALKNNYIRKKIIKEIKQNNIAIQKKIKIKLTLEEVDILWPQTKKSTILNGLLKCYLTLEYSEVLFLVGFFSDKQLNEIKWKIRDKYAICKFSNCLHTPADENECKQQLHYLENRNNYSYTYHEIPETSLKIWQLINKYGWNHEFSKCNKKKYVLYLLNDNYNTIDYVAETISNVLKKYSLEVSYILVLQAEMNDSILIDGFDNENECNRIKEILIEKYLNIKKEVLS